MPPEAELSPRDVTPIFRAEVRAGLLAVMSPLVQLSPPPAGMPCRAISWYLTFEELVEPLDPRLPISVVVALAEVNQSALDLRICRVRTIFES